VRDPRFLRIFGLAVVLHTLWNSPIALPFYFKYIMLGFVAWVVNLALIQGGLMEVRTFQQQARDGKMHGDSRLRSV
jgi:RsiW-degrading membrane proteinase PrsW (M82 family)